MVEFITPIKPIETFAINRGQNEVEKGNKNLFSEIYNNAIKDVKDSQLNLENQQYLLATGQVTDGHNVTIAAAEAQLTVDMLVQLRNHAIESYNELIRMNV